LYHRSFRKNDWHRCPNPKIKEDPMKLKPVLASVTLACAGGMVAAATIQPGDLVVSEVLANPAAVADSTGEWLEIYNTTAAPLDINNLLLRDNGSNSHTISTSSPLWIDPGDYLVLGRSGDTGSNGGYTPDYVYRDFTLANSIDSIILEWNQQTIFALTYSGADGFGEAGVSMQLESLEEIITAGNYLPSQPSMAFGAGDLGTPGFGSLGEGLGQGVSEVPIPAAGVLFLSSLGLLAGIKRRNELTA
jgi:hypothetical protein